MVERRQTTLSLIYIVVSLIVGLSAAWVGIQITD